MYYLASATALLLAEKLLWMSVDMFFKIFFRAHCNFFVKLIETLLQKYTKKPHHPGGF